MKKCLLCDGTRHYKLSDGRLKCRRCKNRFSWKSAWESCRLSESAKKQLLEWFVLGVPVYRQRFMAVASAPATERFYRLARACAAYEEQLREPFDSDPEPDETTTGDDRRMKRKGGAASKVFVFGIIKQNDLVKIMPVAAPNRADVINKIQAYTREGSLYYTDERQAYATLRMKGAHIVIRKEKGTPAGTNRINEIEGFWSYAKNWLYPYRGIPHKHFHLYLGEVCYRFNHRNEDLKPLITKLLKTTNASDIASSLVRIRYELP